jgi:molecular chaperone DnaJ
MCPERDPHRDLGVPVDATMEEIHRAFRRLLREHHPDTRPLTASSDESDRALHRAVAAYATLRERHARSMLRRPAGPPSPEAGAADPPVSSPLVRATPVSWSPPRSPTRRGPPELRHIRQAPSLESLIRWLLGDEAPHDV